MSILPSIIKQRIGDTIDDTKAALLHTLYPDEFAFFLVAIELYRVTESNVYDQSTLEDILIFPVNPTSINEALQTKKNIQKGVGGVVVIDNPSHKPFPITISGTFGRRWKLMFTSTDLGNAFSNLTGTKKDRFNKMIRSFETNFHSGYGFSKKLEHLVWKSSQVQPNGQPYQMVYTNLGWNTRYFVEPMDFVANASLEMNGIWTYSINLTATAPFKITSTENRAALLASKIISGVVSSLATDLASALNNSNVNKLKGYQGA